MLASIISNYIFGILINNAQNTASSNKPLIMVSLGIMVNIAILVSFKYANFIADNINVLLSHFQLASIDISPIHLPLGISFFTFQAISYIVDIYRKEVLSQKNIFNLALYISLFPQLIAGPIIRYHDINLQITNRSHSIELLASGIKKFICGLAKKMLIANSLGEVADNIFSLNNNDLTTPIAWLGVLCYTLQIYFDFSGYSDMAIGLGRMFGFRFLENFNYPYIATSVREFWRRWHISLSTWFRDYVYFSLGGNRVPTLKVYRNLLLVFILTGIWHGASWNFLVWGLFHGFFLASEHAGLNKIIDKFWQPIQHLYLLSIIIISWVFFRADNLVTAIDYLGVMFSFNQFHTTAFQFFQVTTSEAVYAFFIGCILATPVYPWSIKKLSQVRTLSPSLLSNISAVSIPTILLLLSIFKVASSTYNPFIYFRF